MNASVPPNRTFALRSHTPDGVWESNDNRYRNVAHQSLAELEHLCEEVRNQWPIKARESIQTPALYPEVAKLAKRRDQASDATRVYAAMAVEGFLNFYGVVRLGQQAFDDHFERLGLVPKLRCLLLLCDQLNCPRNDPLVLLLDKVAQSRNALVHPKATEVVGDFSRHVPIEVPMPSTARLAVENMEAFFAAFVAAVPEAEPHLRRADA